MTRPLSVALLALLLPLASPPFAPAARDEIVPGGAWLVRATVTRDTLDRAITKLNAEGPLLEYAVPEPALRSRITGTLERDVTRATLHLQWGLSDTWNLALAAPRVRIEQRSTLATTSADPAVQAQVERLRTRTVSGVGDVRLTVLHRSVYNDRNSLVWGFGYETPGEDPVSPYAGRTTLLLGSISDRAFGLLHYTFYPFLGRARLDVRAEVGRTSEEPVETLQGGTLSVDPGNTVDLSLDWRQEFGPVLTGAGLRVFDRSESSEDGQKQSDGVQDYSVRLELGFGNLRALEQGPIAFPYRVLLHYEQTFQGFNTPLRRELQLSLQTYF